MKHLVFIVGSYYPKFSAVGSCVYNVVNSIKDTCKVTVICSVNKSDEKLLDTYEGCEIIRVAPRKMLKRLSTEENMGKYNGLKGRFNKAQLIRLRGEKYLTAILSKENIEVDLAREYYGALASIKEPIDAIIPACLPFEGVLAGIKFGKENNIKVIPYFFDPFADNEALHRTKSNKDRKMKRHLNLEAYVIKNSEKVIMMNHMVSHFEDCFPEYKDKFIYLEHPTLIIGENNENDEVKNHGDKINLTYAGAFNKGIREPDYLLELISRCKDNIELNLYTVGNCSSIIKEYSDKNSGKILNHGSVDKSTAHKALKASDVLVSVGNVVSNQTPSKIFEYIAMGKPLIHLYYNEDDQVINILNKYDLALCIKQSEAHLEENLKKIENFCCGNFGRTMDSEKIKALYKEALPETTGNVILKLISKDEKGR